MRVTERRMIEVAGTGVSRAREQVARASSAVTGGARVERPSDDPVAWAAAARADARSTLSAGRGAAIDRSRERLGEADGALEGLGQLLSRARELAVELGNDTYGPQERAGAATELQALRTQALALANSRAGDGEYLFAGSRGGAAPFDAAGVYVGDTLERTIASGEQATAATLASGTFLTASAGVDVFATLDTLATALATNNAVGVRASLDPLATAVAQVADARAGLGGRAALLDDASAARESLEQHLVDTYTDALAADPVAAAMELARAQEQLQTARAAAETLIGLAAPKR